MSNNYGKQVEQDWRFAELIARTWMEPGLAERYAADPCTVLAEFGLTVARPEDAPALEPFEGPDLIIEDVEHARGSRLRSCGFSSSYTDDDDEGRDGDAANAAARTEPTGAAETYT
jgi:hypothetical protein